MSDMLDGSWSNWVPPEVTITRKKGMSDTLDGSWNKLGSPDVTTTRQVRYIRHVRRQLEQPGFS